MKQQGKYPGDGYYWVCDFCDRHREVLHLCEGVPPGWILYESAHGEIHVCQECYAKAIVTVLRQIHESSGKSCPGE